MPFMTDRKRALGLGSAKEGAARHWSVITSSVALVILIPLFTITFGPFLGRPHAEVVAHFARPYPAIVAALTILVGFMHFKNGVQVLIEDYVHGIAREVLIIATICLSYAAAAIGLFAIARIAL